MTQWLSVNGIKYDSKNGPDVEVFNTIEAVRSNKECGEGVLAAMFLHPCLKSGHLVH